MARTHTSAEWTVIRNELRILETGQLAHLNKGILLPHLLLPYPVNQCQRENKAISYSVRSVKATTLPSIVRSTKMPQLALNSSACPLTAWPIIGYPNVTLRTAVASVAINTTLAFVLIHPSRQGVRLINQPPTMRFLLYQQPPVQLPIPLLLVPPLLPLYLLPH